MSQAESMGAALRSARTEKKINIERAADELKIRQEFLMRMESDEFDFLAPAYARGFLRSYVRYLGLDERPFLEEFDHRHGDVGGVDASQIAAVDQDTPRRGFREHRSISLITVFIAAGAGILLLLALVGIFAPEKKPERRGTPVVKKESTPTPLRTVPDKKKKGRATPTPDPSSTLLADGIDLQVQADDGPCWVDVESDGEQIFAATLDIGESETFQADKDMTIVLGAPSSVSLVLNDRPVDSLDTQGPGAVKLQLPDELFRLGVSEEPLTETPAATPSPSPSASTSP